MHFDGSSVIIIVQVELSCHSRIQTYYILYSVIAVIFEKLLRQQKVTIKM